MARLPLANWNGTELPLDEVQVPALDRAFLFGDAVYEALRVYGGRPWLCREHFGRLTRSLELMRIDADVAEIEDRMRATLASSGVQNGLIYLQVTRGAAPRTHWFPPETTTPNVLLWVSELDGDPYAALRETGAQVITHEDLRWARRDIKSVNLLGNCLAAQAAREAGCQEAILVSADGRLTEGTHTNLFGVNGGRLLTSPTGHHILPGITRSLVLRLAERAGVPVVEEPLTRDNVYDVDELFLTGTTTEVLAVTMVDGRAIGSGPGEITRRLANTYHETVREWLATAE